MLRKIFKIGHSLAITISKQILSDLGLKAGDRVQLAVDKDRGYLQVKQAGKKEQLALGLKIRKKF